MDTPKFPLGVPLMDEDHFQLEQLFETVDAVADDGLAAFQEKACAEVAAHFAREEELMRAHEVPVLHCHIAQHQRVLAELEAAKALARAGDLAGLRLHLTRDLPSLVMAHVASVDQVTAHFLRGSLEASAFCNLRLPTES